MVSSIRVLIVDDSPFMRYTIAKHLEAIPDISVVGSAQNGLEALAKIPALKPDVVTLDVEMPNMDGLTALQRIMNDCPTSVIMLSSLTRQGSRTTIQALMRGAVDFVAKPTASTDIRTVIEELATKIKTAAQVRISGRGIRKAEWESKPAIQNQKSEIQPFRPGVPVIVIGASTGGPQALQQVLAAIPTNLPAAIVIVQHMPAGFTRSLARRLNEASSFNVQEAADGDRLAQGLALVAPGDYHLRFINDKRVALDHSPRRHHVRPAVDITLESAAEHYKKAVIGVILTGMGCDGTAGAACVKAAGGKVIVEDESTSIVYGMPRSVVEAGLADQVVPLPKITSTLVELVNDATIRI
ncbi:MAG TPA: chemotaxis response regulator protein-glutamate methylesterase [Anaerolineae bacterium]|nr:chemotaxis response regulator protein-glutamate methylesterase [Anaerolineae bacterium]